MDTAAILATLDGTARRAAEAALARWDDVVALSQDLHAHPETAFREVESSRRLREFLAAAGFDVTAGVGRLPTAFAATCGSGEVVVALCVEYDALPNGHACGHNIIAGAGLLAAVGLQAVAAELGITVKVIGTPAEEHGGGKVFLLADGAFDDVHCALMVHAQPDGEDRSMIGCTSQAVARFEGVFTGVASHAAGAPEKGVNAADAVTVAQVALGLLRQQLTDGYRAAMIVKEAGVVTNIIPERAVVEFEMRAPDVAEFELLQAKVLRCLEAGSVATGCELAVRQTEPTYLPLRHDEILTRHWDAAYAGLGREVPHAPKVETASTDFGNVGQVLPAVHPWVALRGVDAGLHSDGFRAGAASEAGMEAMHDGGLAMALAVVAAVTDEQTVAYLREQKAARPSLRKGGPVPGQDQVRAISAELGLVPDQPPVPHGSDVETGLD